MIPKESHKEWIRHIFSGTALNYGQRNNSFFDHFASGLVRIADLQVGDHILDVATGRGAIVKCAAPLLGDKGRAVGVDFSPEMIQLTAQEITGAEFHTMDAENLTFSDASFDVVFCGFGMFLFSDPQRALSEFFRILKPGGKLFFSAWQKDNGIAQAAFKEEIFLYTTTKTNLHSFHDRQFIREIVEGCNFQQCKIQIDKLDHVYPSIEAWFESLWFQGSRGNLEKLSAEQLDTLKQRLVNRLTPELKSNGLHNIFQAFYVEAKKPG